MDYYRLKACVRCGGDLARDDGDWICMQCGAYSYVGLYRQQELSLSTFTGLPSGASQGPGESEGRPGTEGPVPPDFSKGMSGGGTSPGGLSIASNPIFGHYPTPLEVPA